MAEQISDSERLDLNDNILEDNIGNKTTPISPTMRWTDTQNSSHGEDKTTAIQRTPETEEQKAKKTRGKSRNTRQTLRSLDRKLDKIHQDLAQVSRSQQWKESQQRPRSLMGRNPPYKSALTYELTPTAARVVFHILDPNSIQGLHMDQKIIVETPRRYVARPLWRDSRGQVMSTLSRASHYAKFLHIPGLHVIQISEVQFHFTPARAYRNLLVEERVTVDDGIRIRLTRLATTQEVVFPRGVYLGALHITTTLHINSY